MSTAPQSSASLPTPFLAVGREVAERVRAAGGRAWWVGGAVRDRLLGRPVEDLDIEVYGLPAERLRTVLEAAWRLDEVGRAFGVFKLRGWPIDVALPRVERPTGPRHRDFAVTGDPWLDPAVAAARRDFTVNAILLDPLTDEVLDPCGGREDLAARVLRRASEAFGEDPLRVLRAMQLAARLEFAVHPETVAASARLTPEALPRERVFEEWRKLLVAGVRPSLGLRFLQDCGWLRWFPELEALVGCPQDPGWHPEGDVWVHTLHVVDAAARARTGDSREDLIVGLGCLCHDFGKPATTFHDAEAGRIRSPGHEAAGEAPTREFLGRLTREVALVEAVVPLVLHHGTPLQLFRGKASDAAIRRLARRAGRLDRLLRVAAADHAGRPPLPTDNPSVEWIRQRAAELEVSDSAPRPIVLGRHLIELGLAPGQEFRQHLDAAYEAQIDGQFSDLEGGKAFIRTRLGKE